MHNLELKVPPPLVALVMAIAMWCLSRLPPLLEALPAARLIAVVCFAIAGVSFDLSGMVAFRRVKTTVNPMKPELSSSLVTAGIYKTSRNPMYVGMLFLLTAWAAFLWSPWSLFGILGFAGYISRFQIVPEERVLSRLFGAEFADYTERVPRWL